MTGGSIAVGVHKGVGVFGSGRQPRQRPAAAAQKAWGELPRRDSHQMLATKQAAHFEGSINAVCLGVSQAFRPLGAQDLLLSRCKLGNVMGKG